MLATHQRPLTRLLASMLTAVILLLAAVPALSQEGQPNSPIMVPNPATDLWRAVRQREAPASGTSQVKGVETGVLINQAGEDFRDYRLGDFIGNAGLFIGVVAALVGLFYLLRGRIMIDGGRSGRRIRRFPNVDRAAHWVTATLFVVLAITGLNMLFGRYVLLPIMGAEAFGAMANAFKLVHDYSSPVFLVGLVFLILRFAAKNMPSRGDLKWILTGGGIIGKGHASAGFFNAGEKVWFFVVLVLGIAVSGSGLLLLFPVFDQSRELMQLALIVHGISSVIFVAGSFGHIYIGTIGTEGSLESMTTGYVDENWAKMHHDQWYEQIKDETVPEAEVTNPTESPTRPPLQA